jgi:hypothetical protein
MSNITVDEHALRTLLRALETSSFILHALESEEVDTWEGYIPSLLTARYNMDRSLERQIQLEIDNLKLLAED